MGLINFKLEKILLKFNLNFKLIILHLKWKGIVSELPEQTYRQLEKQAKAKAKKLNFVTISIIPSFKFLAQMVQRMLLRECGFLVKHFK